MELFTPAFRPLVSVITLAGDVISQLLTNHETSGTGVRLHGVAQGGPEQDILVHVVDVKMPQLSHLYPYS